MKTLRPDFLKNVKFEYKITLIYLVFGILWILFSDFILEFLVPDISLLTKFQTFKGTFFIIVTSGFLYVLVRKHMQSLTLSELNFYRSISESPMGIRIVSMEGKTIYANKAFLDIYEFNDLEEFTSTPAINRYTPESYIQHQERKIKRKNGNEAFDYEISIVCKNEKIRNVKVSRKEILWNGTRHFQVINIDVTDQRIAEEQLRKLSIAVEQSPDAICISDPEGKIEYVNPKTIQLTGFSAEELINENTRIFSSGEKTKEEYTEMWQIIKSGKIWSGELHNKKKNGELYWESTTISPIFDTTGQITHFLAIKEDITDRKRAEIALNKSEIQLRKFASHLQNVREEEKVALAREIHDELGQTLIALKIDMGLLKNKVVKSNATSSSANILVKFDHILTLMDTTIKTVRRIMNGLRPELLEMNGFVATATIYLREFEDRHQIKYEFNSEISNIEMDSQQSLAFFRIFQEALNNIAKHSKATLVKILLRNESNKLFLEICDNGIGFDKNSSSKQDSYGLIGMKERVVLLEGELDIISEVGQGTCVRVEIPYIRK
ncbi:MAG: PAS domain S-box protein [Paludibacter sp.]|nr:PAS domain S-box protein [Paludibacter sp.]